MIPTKIWSQRVNVFLVLARGVARNSFWVGIFFYCTIYYSPTSSLTTSAAISAQNNWPGTDFGRVYIPIYPPVATPLVLAQPGCRGKGTVKRVVVVVFWFTVQEINLKACTRDRLAVVVVIVRLRRSTTYVRRVSKKGATLIMAITLLILDRFAKFFTTEKSGKFLTKFVSDYPPHLKYVAALPCKI